MGTSIKILEAVLVMYMVSPVAASLFDQVDHQTVELVSTIIQYLVCANALPGIFHALSYSAHVVASRIIPISNRVN